MRSVHDRVKNMSRLILLRSMVLFVLVIGLIGRFQIPSHGQASDENPPTRIDLQLRKVVRQELPDRVRDVRSGPDGRIWLEVKAAGEQVSLPAARKAVEREYDRDRPQVIGLIIVGWGRDGRIWLYRVRGPMQGRGTLLGYDGEEWVQKKLDDYLVVQRSPIVLKNHTLFAARGGIPVFDGSEVTVLQDVSGFTKRPRIVPDPERRSAVLHFSYKQ